MTTMTIHQQQITITTNGRSTINITTEIERIIRKTRVQIGLCHVFIHHTSASLMITENADPDVRRDMETIFTRLAPDGDPEYYHTLEGSDDMSAHIRTVLTQTEISIPISNSRLSLGTWQGLFLWEHRVGRFQRTITVTIQF